MEKLAILKELSELYGESERDGRRLVHLQAPQVRDHWERPGDLALAVLAVERDNLRIVRAFWNIRDDARIERPDHVEYS